MIVVLYLSKSLLTFIQHHINGLTCFYIVYPNNFKLYKTNNIFTFLKLDTRNGRIWQVQYNVEDSKRFETTLNFRSLVYESEKDEIPGRFELHPTTNTYIFIMLDKIDGRSWQVQWNIDRNKRFVDIIQ